jgi:hypothetical protein
MAPFGMCYLHSPSPALSRNRPGNGDLGSILNHSRLAIFFLRISFKYLLGSSTDLKLEIEPEKKYHASSKYVGCQVIVFLRINLHDQHWINMIKEFGLNKATTPALRLG